MLTSMDPSSPTYLLDTPCRYRILTIGILAAGWSNRLGGMTISTTRLADGTTATTLIGELADRLRWGVVNTLHDLGLALVSVERVSHTA
jgi:hypothetical protein